MTAPRDPQDGQGQPSNLPLNHAPLPTSPRQQVPTARWWFRIWTPAWKWLLPRVGADPAPPEDDPSATPVNPSQAAAGRWPSTKQSFWWDLGPNDLAPDADGVVAPTFTDTAWVARAAAELSPGQLEKLLAAEHERNLGFQASAATSEGKASRLLTPIVALLTADATLVAFELNSATGRHRWWSLIPYVGAGLGAVAALLLVVAALRALDADTRVGMYNAADPLQRAQPDAVALSQEVRGSALARWSSVNKSTRVMYARAALSRALLLITLALLLGAATVVTGRWASDSAPSHAGATGSAAGHESDGPGSGIGVQTGPGLTYHVSDHVERGRDQDRLVARSDDRAVHRPEVQHSVRGVEGNEVTE